MNIVSDYHDALYSKEGILYDEIRKCFSDEPTIILRRNMKNGFDDLFKVVFSVDDYFKFLLSRGMDNRTDASYRVISVEEFPSGIFATLDSRQTFLEDNKYTIYGVNDEQIFIMDTMGKIKILEHRWENYIPTDCRWEWHAQIS